MAKQTGIVKYSGTLGGVRHFKIKGLTGDFAGLSGGPSAEQIANDPAFIRTRENMSEFGGCAKTGKSIRNGLSILMKQMGDPQVTGRLTAVMKRINLNDTSGIRGERGVLISQNQNDLVGFNFDKNLSPQSVFFAPINISTTPTRNSATFTVTSFQPSAYINAPAGATHFRLINALSVVSDYVYDTLLGVYQPSNPSLDGISEIQYSPYTDLSAATPIITLTSTLPGSPIVTTDVSVLCTIGIEFYQQVGTNYYLFASGNCMHIANVF
jgi:hypothetical protein